MAKAKCNRCDRRFSNLRLRCPYCGAHRSKKTVRKEQEEMSRSKFIIGGVILLILIAAAVVLVVTSLYNNPQQNLDDNTNLMQPYNEDDGVTSVDNNNNNDNPNVGTAAGNENPTEQGIKSVNIVRDGEVQTDITMHEGDTYEFSYETNPAGSEEIPVWTSDDSSIAVVLQNGQVTAVGEGSTFINVTVGGKTGSMVVRVK